MRNDAISQRLQYRSYGMDCVAKAWCSKQKLEAGAFAHKIHGGVDRNDHSCTNEPRTPGAVAVTCILVTNARFLSAARLLPRKPLVER